MKKAYVLLVVCLVLFGFLFLGCEEVLEEEGAGNGYIEVHIDTADIASEKHYFYRGRNTSDDTYFSSESRTGAAIITNLGNFQSPLLNVGTWVCDVYELTEHYAGSEAPSSTIITRQSLGNSAIVVKDETTRITVQLAP